MMHRQTEILAACIGSTKSVGAVRFARTVGTSLYVYSERGSVKRRDLREIQTYLGTGPDVWCDHEHDLERHEFRVVDQSQELADLLFNESREDLRRNRSEACAILEKQHHDRQESE